MNQGAFTLLIILLNLFLLLPQNTPLAHHSKGYTRNKVKFNMFMNNFPSHKCPKF